MADTAVDRLRRMDTLGDARSATTRLQAAYEVLATFGAKPGERHDREKCDGERVMLPLMGEGNCEGFRYTYDESVPKPCLVVEWPDWVSDEVLKAAFECATAIMGERLRFHQRAVEAEHGAPTERDPEEVMLEKERAAAGTANTCQFCATTEDLVRIDDLHGIYYACQDCLDG